MYGNCFAFLVLTQFSPLLQVQLHIQLIDWEDVN